MKILKFNGVKKAIIVLTLAIMLSPLAVSAYSIKKGDSIYVPKGEIIEGSLYAVGAAITVDGQVNGDLICAGQSININGQVAGDVICAGQSININGEVGGSLRAAGNSINLGGKIARNLMAFAATIQSTASSSVGWDMLTVGGFGQIMGSIGRDLYGSLGQATLAGPIGKNVNLNLGGQNKKTAAPALTITSAAKINGEVKYTSNQEAAIENTTSIKGKITHNLPTVIAKKPNFISLAWWWGNLIAVFSALVIGLVLISFWREPMIKITDLMLNKIGVSLGWGILVLLLAPLIAIILLITIIGIPLSLILIAVWLIALYISKILVGILTGRYLLNNLLPKQKDSLILGMVIGIVIINLIFALPFLGWIMSFLATLWGLGGIMLTLKKS